MKNSQNYKSLEKLKIWKEAQSYKLPANYNLK